MDLVTVTVPSLVRLSRQAQGLSLGRRRILAEQSGGYGSPFRGRGMEFDESRPYQPGDDIRNINWRVTARTGRTHTKLFREERERPVFLWLDLRHTMFFATRGRFKAVIAAELGALLAWSAAFNGDRVGAVVFSEEAHRETRPERGKGGVLRFIRETAAHPAWAAERHGRDAAQAAGRALLHLRRLARPGSALFLISDFRHLPEQSWNDLLRLSARHDVVLVFLHDPLERELPPPGRYRISDGRAEHVLDTFDQSLVEQHRQRFEQHLGKLRATARSGGMRLVVCSTADDPASVLQAQMGARRG
jgi:uncharacterized protein (DUF58 family)